MSAITPVAEIRSKKMKVGDTAAFQAVDDVVQSGSAVIPCGAVVKAKSSGAPLKVSAASLPGPRWLSRPSP